MKARGRFGAVWRAELSPGEVAIKVFPLKEKDSWVTEQSIFEVSIFCQFEQFPVSLIIYFSSLLKKNSLKKHLKNSVCHFSFLK